MAKIKFLSTEEPIQTSIGTDFQQLKIIHPYLPIAFGCRQGNCGACAIRLTHGRQNLTKLAFNEHTTLLRINKLPADGWRLACQCAINGDVEIN